MSVWHLWRLAGLLGVSAAAALCAKTVAPLLPAGTLGAAGGFLQNPAAAVCAAEKLVGQRQGTLQEVSAQGSAGTAQSGAQAGAETAPSAAANAQTAADSQTAANPAQADAPAPQALAPPAEDWDGVLPEGALPTAEETFSQGSGQGYAAAGAGSIKNATQLSDSAVAEDLALGMPFAVQKDSAEPQVLIMHTHTTETYLTESAHYAPAGWSGRTTDETQNVCAVGEAMAEALNAAGIATLHDKTLHDYPSYNGSYAASNQTVRQYLAAYPSIRVVLDVHRDAIERSGTLIAPVAMVQGERTAQVMIICGCDQNGNLPNCMENLRFAAAWEAQMESAFPGLTRPVLFDYRYYNQDLTTGSLLIEVGGHGNTLTEAVRAGRLAGQALAQLLGGE